jgi:aryl-alcohol dehydrogenase-like predicted oxidoreductase
VGTNGIGTDRITIGGDLEVGRIGYGAMQHTGDGVWGEYPDRDGGIDLLRRAVDAGVTFIDTADIYGPHTNEVLIRDALAPYPAGLVIATKGGFVRGGADLSYWGAVGNSNYLRQCAYMSARRLGVEQLDIYYLHSGRATDAPFEEQIATLASLREAGVIRHVGLSNVTVEQFEVAQQIVEIAAVTAHYNVGERGGAGLLEAAEKSGVVFSPWHPAAIPHGDDAARFHAALDPIAEKHDVSLPQLGLAWLLHRSSVMLPIPGTRSLSHLQDNLSAGAVQLDPCEVTAMTELVPE